jgi:hypothetical protein
MPDSDQRRATREQIGAFHKRAGDSHAEARKLLTAMSVGTLGVIYATLTHKDAPTLDAYDKALAILSIVSMTLSAGFGLAAWRADAAWAFRTAENFKKHPTAVKPNGGCWHLVKKSCDIAQLTFFGLGLLMAASLTLGLLR